MPRHSEPPVVIVGAGIAGLACGLDLTAAGVPVQILDAADGVGGRMRTDQVGGFLLDRGFQVFNTSYPQVKRRINLRALQLRPFTPGVLLHAGDRRLRFADPTRQLGGVADLLRGRLAGPSDAIALARLCAADMLLPVSLIKNQPDRTTIAALTEEGISPALCELFFRPFLSGVFLEEELETSGRFFHLVWRSMLRGSLCLPRRGIQAVPEQLAAALPAGTVRLETPVRVLTADGVLCGDGTEIPARAVIVATGAAEAAALLPGLSVPATRSVTTFYHAAPSAPLAEPVLLVDTERKILNTVVLDGGHRRLRRRWPGADLHIGARRCQRAGAGRPGADRRNVRCRRLRLGASGHVSGVRRAAGDARAASAQPAHASGAPPLRLRRPPGHRLGPGRDGVRDPRRP